MAKRILIIEDETNIAESLAFLLGREGFEVSVHADGADALEAVAARDPDLVILDVMLPNRSGFDILQDLRRAERAVPLPVMMLTAKGQKRDRELALEAGADCFMTKPFSNAEIVAQVHALLPPDSEEALGKSAGR